MENEILKINKQCFSNLIMIRDALPNVETKGDSSVILVKVRTLLETTLQQIQEDNKEKEGITISEEKEKKEG